MLNKIMKKLLIILLITIIFLYFTKIENVNEGFRNGGRYSNLYPIPKYCRNCYQKGPGKCMQCNNCGWCVDGNGYGSCVLGDQSGPYFADCVQYFYNGGRKVLMGSRRNLYTRRLYNPPGLFRALI